MNELFALVPGAWSDARGILARRWWLVIVVAALQGLQSYEFVASRLLHSPEKILAQFGFIVAAITLSSYVYADTMRLGDPGYRLTFERFCRLALIGVGYGAALLILAIPSFIAQRAHLEVASAAFVFAANALVSARFAYVYFAAEAPEGAFFSSWRITAGTAFRPSLVVATIYAFEASAIPRLTELALGSGAATYGAVVGAVAIFTCGAQCFFMPWFFRWMRVAEAMQPPAVAAEEPLEIYDRRL